MLIEIDERVGMWPVAKGGLPDVANLTKVVPVAGGLDRGRIDALHGTPPGPARTPSSRRLGGTPQGT